MIIFESTFPKDYRSDEIKRILDHVTTGKFCQLVCIPGAGKATILRLLAHNRNVLKLHLGEKEKSIRFIYSNLLELTSYDDAQIAKFLLLALDQKIPKTDDSLVLTKQLNETVNNLAGRGQTLVLLFDHFDEYQNRLPRSFFQLLRGLNSVAKYKFAAVFATRRDLRELIDPEILKEFYDFFVGNTVYMQVWDKAASDFMFAQIEEVFKKKIPDADKKNILQATAGHAKLTKITAELFLRENIKLSKELLLASSLVRAALFELWLFLTAPEQQVLIQIAKGNEPEKDQTLESLEKFDLVKQDLSFTIPLFPQFVLKIIPTITPQKITYDQNTKEIRKGENVISDLLSPQEYRLLKFLIENQGKIAERDQIIKFVWPDAKAIEGISDEAIDQMVFRLRKKIEDEPNSPKHIITLKGQGLRFAP